MTFYDVTWKLAIGNFYRVFSAVTKTGNTLAKRKQETLTAHSTSSVELCRLFNKKKSETVRIEFSVHFSLIVSSRLFPTNKPNVNRDKKKQRKSCWVEILHRRHFPIVPLFFTLQSIIRRSIYYTLQKNDSFSSYNVNLMNIVRDDDE